MSIKVFRVKIEGFVVKRDVGGLGPELTPADWGPETIIKAMEAIEVTETLVDTIEDEEEGGVMPDTYAEVKWSVGDVQTLRPNWTEAQYIEFLSDNGKYIQEAMVLAGWEAMRELIGGENEEEGE
mgnify:FL=1